MRKTWIMAAVLIGMSAGSAGHAAAGNLPFDQDPCKTFANNLACQFSEDLKKQKYTKPKFDPWFIPPSPPPQSDATPCPDALPKAMHVNATCCEGGESTIWLVTEKLYACKVIPAEAPKAGEAPQPEPKPDEGPKCSANQMLVGGTLCCDLATETPDFIGQTCKKKTFNIVAPPPSIVIPPVGEPTTQSNGESNCALRPADDRPQGISLGSAWLLVCGAALLMVLRATTERDRGSRP